MIESGVKGVEFIVANTDLQVLNDSLAPIKLQLGSELTDGLGAGANPEIGREAALESKAEIEEALKGGVTLLQLREKEKSLVKSRLFRLFLFVFFCSFQCRNKYSFNFKAIIQQRIAFLIGYVFR